MSGGSIQVVLRDDVDNLGKSGELVKVKAGYARNYLIPRGLAAVATRGNVARIEHEKKAAVARGAKLKKAALDRAGSLDGATVEIKAHAGESDKLFGSVGAKDIAEALVAKGFEVDRKKIVLAEPIKDLGEHELKIKLGYDVVATVKVVVVRG
jgi:large subunit ribosomal protein L9